MSKTISPFLIILSMTHMIEFVSSAASVFVTWDVIWILVTLTFFSNLHTVREYIYVCTNLWDGRDPVLMDLECSGTLGFFNVSSFLVEACRKVETLFAILSYSTIQQNRGNPTKASGMLMIQIFTPIVSTATAPKCLLVFISAKRIWRITQVHEIPL